MNSQEPEKPRPADSEIDHNSSEDKATMDPIRTSQDTKKGFWEILPAVTTFLGTVVLSGVSLWMSHSVQQLEIQRQERESQREALFKQAQVEQQKAQIRVEELKALTALAPLITSRDAAQRQMGLNILRAVRTSSASDSVNPLPQDKSTKPEMTSSELSREDGFQRQRSQAPRSRKSSTIEAYAEIALSNTTPIELRENAARQIAAVYKSPSAGVAERAVARRELTRIKNSSSPRQIRTIAAEGLSLVAKWEGTRLKAYQDPMGVMVIGSGHTLSEKELASGKLVIDGKEVDYTVGLTSKQARDLLDQDLEPIRRAVDELVNVPINKNQRDALVSFAFNVGLGTLKESALLKALNDGNYTAVPAEFMKWTRAGGMELPGMLQRRKEEVELWNKPP